MEKKYYLILLILAGGMIYFAAGGSGGPSRPENMGYPINTRGDDFCPSLTGDGSVMVFSSREKGEADHNIFMCARDGASWSRPEPVKKINTRYNEETPFISYDGTAILFASDRPESTKPPVTANKVERITFDIYYSKKTADGWSAPLPIPGDVNTRTNERAPALSRDKQELYFTRWPFKNIQRSRIMSAMLKGDIYTGSEELPDPVNTGNYEMGLRPEPDGQGFYFSSMRPGGYGGWDIYHVPHKKGLYGAVRNLGPEINSPENDLFFAKTATGYYFCSNRKGALGRYDLYTLETGAAPEKMELSSRAETVNKKKTMADMLPPDRENVPATPKPHKGKTKITFTIIDEKTGRPLSMKFRVYLKNTPDPAAPALRTISKQSDSNGIFSVVPKSDITHIMIRPEDDRSIAMQSVKVEPRREKSVSIVIGRADREDVISVPSLPEKTELYAEDTGGEPESVGTIQNILFDTNSANIRMEYYPFIHNLIHRLRANPSLKLTITGHADRRGREDANEALSLSRAEAVRDYLVRMGIEETRVKTKGMGDRKPLVRYDFISQVNRRVEFTLY